MAKKDKKSGKDQQQCKTPELAAAKKALEKYFKENNLDPTKDYTKDKKHGKAVSKLVSKLNKERDKVAAQFPESDPKTMKRLKKKGENQAKAIEKKTKEEAAKKDKAPRVAKYDYPLIDGREMTSVEKKKYRAEQRKLASGGTEKPATEKKEKKAKKTEEAPTTKVDKKSKKDKKKKAHKDED